MKSDKIFETVNHIIQTSYKDSPNTKIYQNYKIPNRGGRKREIDIFIETKINDIEIKIAIECKNYNSKVSVEKIEAFKAKCERIPSINKKIFITKEGFQKDAKIAAKEFGIDLHLLKEIDEKQVLSWLKIEIPTPIFITRKLTNLRVQFHGIAPEFRPDSIFFSENQKQGIKLYEFLREVINRHFPAFPVVVVVKGEELTKDVYEVTLDCNNSFLEVKGEKHKVKQIGVHMEINYEHTKGQVSLNALHHFGEEGHKAQVATVIAENGEVFSFVKKNDKNKIEVYIGKKSAENDKKEEIKFIHMADMKIEKIKNDRK